MFKCLSLFLAAILLVAGCGEVPLPVDTDAPRTDTTADAVNTVEADTAPAISQKDLFDPEADTRYGTAVNVDCDAIWYMYAANGQVLENVEQMCIDWFELRYKDAGVSDVMYHIDQHVPSVTRESYMDFYIEAQKTGEQLDEVTEKHGELLYRVYEEHNVDPYAIWFDLCRENGINPWLSFRMNDIHAPTLGYACTDFYYEALKNGWLIGENTGRGAWVAPCMDYAVPEVRAYFLDYIDEILGKYDVYGIELDWLRSLFCFKQYSKDNCQYMDIFMEDVNKIVAKYEAEYGHEIKIIARLARDLDTNLYFGFDIVNWAKNGWLDIISPASHGPTDSGVPIPAWKEAMDPYGVEVYIGFESVTIDSKHPQTITTLAGFTAMYLQQGADKVYLYNLFNADKGYYKICSSLEAAMKYAKREYLVTSQTKVPKVDEVSKYDPLPIAVSGGKESEPVILEHGRLSTKRDLYIYVGITNKNQEKVESYNLKVMYNGVECEYQGSAIRSHATVSDSLQCVLSFIVPFDAWKNAERAEITFLSDGYIRVGYVELLNGHPAFG